MSVKNVFGCKRGDVNGLNVLSCNEFEAGSTCSFSKLCAGALSKSEVVNSREVKHRIDGSEVRRAESL